MKNSNLLITCIFAVVCLLSHSAFGQQKKIDSLIQVLKTAKEDTNKVNILTQLCAKTQNNDPKGAQDKSNLALALSKKLKWVKGESYAYFALGNAVSNLGDYRLAIRYLNQADSLNAESNDEKFSAKILGRIGINYWASNDYAKAIQYCDKALALAIKSKDRLCEGDIYRFYGLIYDSQDLYAKALEYALKGLKITRALKNKISESACLQNVGLAYIKMQDYQNALKYFKLANQIGIELNDKKIQGGSLSNIGNVYSWVLNNSKAIEVHEKALVFLREINDKRTEASTLANLASSYFNLKDYNNAMKYSKEALVAERLVGQNAQVAYTLVTISGIFTATGNFSAAKDTLLKALKMAQESGDNSALREVWHSLSDLYEKTHSSQALEAFKNYIAFRDSVTNIDNQKELTRKSVQFDFDTKEAARKADQDKKDIVTKQEIKAGIFQRNAFIGGGVMLLLLSGLLLNRNQHIQKSRNAISKEKLLTEEKSIALEKLNTIQNKLFSIISHDMRSPLMSVDAFIQVIRKGNVAEDELELLIARLDTSVHTTLNLLENLLAWAKSRIKDSNFIMKNVDLNRIAEENLSLYKHIAKEKELKITTNINQGTEIWSDYNVVSLVFRNLLNNAIKFTRTGGEITLEEFHNENHSGFSIQDTGVGMPPEIAAKLFSLNDENIRTGTSNERGTGLGLALCFELLEKTGGTIKVESVVGKGTRFIVSFPNA